MVRLKCTCIDTKKKEAQAHNSVIKVKYYREKIKIEKMK